jgi:DNA end-binding protein Ku
VVIEPEELAALRAAGERAITIDAIVGPQSIDPVYFTEKSYYLVPDGAVGQKPFALVTTCLAGDEMQAIARVVLFGREELAVVRPVEGLLALTVLKYEAEVTHAESFAEDLETPSLAFEEVSLTKRLLKAFHKTRFSLAKYKDDYVEELTKLVEAKAEGKDFVAPPATEEPQVINLMDALKKSVAQARGEEDEEEAKPARRRKLAPSARKSRATTKARRKSG